MLVGTDVCVRMVFVWEETGVPGGNSPVWLGDHMTISHADAGYRTRVAAVRALTDSQFQLLFFPFHFFFFSFFIPAKTANDSDFEVFPDFILYFFCPILFLEKEPVFRFKCLVLNKGTTGAVSITFLVWRGLWLGIEPGTSRTGCQHWAIEEAVCPTSELH